MVTLAPIAKPKLRIEVKGNFTYQDAIKLAKRRDMEIALNEIAKGIFNF